jgi:hypothetical protein
MPEWTRNFPWRQGNLLTDEAVKAINLFHPRFSDDTVVVVATHDCDLAQSPDNEPHVEVIIGRRIQKLDGNNTHAKSSRSLHIEFSDSAPMLAEFVVTEKRIIEKNALVDFNPDEDYKLSPSNLSTFQLWLASRYRRSAFPDEFERRMKESGLTRKISKSAKQHGKMITAVFFDVDEGHDIPHAGPKDVYTLGIILLHETEPDFNAAEIEANKAKAAIEHAFMSKLYDEKSGFWQSIELKYIEVVSEESLSYRQSKLLRKWRLDHISLGDDPQQSVLAE